MPSWKVQLPDYPVYHLVTGFTEGRGAGGRKLKLAEAEAVREGLRPSKCSDLVTLMLLHDAVIVRTPGPYRINDVRLYGRTQELQRRSIRRIMDATVEELPRYAVTSVVGEGNTVFHVVDREAPEADQPAIVASYDNLGAYGVKARSAAEVRAAELNRPAPIGPDASDLAYEDDCARRCGL